jgi:hypothetical protein
MDLSFGMTMRLNALLPTAAILTFVLSGCGSSDRVTVYHVRGTIRLEGKAMPGGGAISFIPMENQRGKTAGGEIREDGTYELMTYSPGDGSMAGYFKVVITQASSMEPREAPPDGQKLPEKGLEILSVPSEDLIPAAYGDLNKTPLRATVEPRSQEINFDLQRKLNQVDESQPAGVAGKDLQQEWIVVAVSGPR